MATKNQNNKWADDRSLLFKYRPEEEREETYLECYSSCCMPASRFYCENKTVKNTVQIRSDVDNGFDWH